MEDGEIKKYNSQLVVSPEGVPIKSYQKHFLFETDKVRYKPLFTMF
jgi:predicted amidohydrolase